MTPGAWTSWPSREALSRTDLTSARRSLNWAVRCIALGVLLWSTFTKVGDDAGALVAAVSGLAVCVGATWALFRTSLEHRLWPSVALLAVLLGVAALAEWTGLTAPAAVLWCGCAVTALERLPLAAALPCTAAALGAYALLSDGQRLTIAVTTVGLALVGYVMRLDAEARGSAQRLLVQERAALAAEAESAALAERSRIAREIHDVLAHSLSAQMVHLEAARLLIERDAGRDQILERVVAARGMAREGLVETRQALSALRGEMTPVEEFLEEVAGSSRLAVTGDRRQLPAEASQAVRRVAQEAMTNVRKHAPGAEVRLRLEYLPDEVTLEVRDSGRGEAVDELAVSGSGYGLVGMRERAELIGGTLEAGPDEEGFLVRLRVPA
ncbi:MULTISPECIES: sensor histidine kinase [unclassified Streptomyces]|uniref:sensor histidine kinase n=1 Tax=unclassified Streptomyces TaxID=2593676 RepID=UPI003244CCA2|nr:histidine kinase [Streptomyces sp. NBC_00932]